jgi:hypothetical protein
MVDTVNRVTTPLPSLERAAALGREKGKRGKTAKDDRGPQTADGGQRSVSGGHLLSQEEEEGKRGTLLDIRA